MSIRRSLLMAKSIALVKMAATSGTGLVSFVTDIARPVKVTCEFSPMQEGSGDPSPDNVRPISGWTECKVGLTGKNLFNKDAVTRWQYIGGSGKPTNSSVFGWAFVYVGGLSRITISGNKMQNTAARYCCYDQYGNVLKNSDYKSNRTMTLPSGTRKIAVTVYVKNNEQKDIDTVQVEAGTTASAYEDYGITIPITFTDPSTGDPMTVYGGTVTLNEDGTGELRKRPYYASYNGEPLVGPWLSSMDVYAEDATPTIGAQVVDLGGDETVYQLTNLQVIDTLYGTNNIWHDMNGSITAEYLKKQ